MPRHQLEQFFSIRQLSSLSISPDGTRVGFVMNASGVPNVWTVPTGGGWAHQVTFRTDRVGAAHWNPRRDEFLFVADTEGNENWELYLVDAEGGSPRKLTNFPQAQIANVLWNRRGTKILFSCNQRDPRFFDVYLLDTRSGAMECVLETDRLMVALAWSNDDRTAIIADYQSNLNYDVFLFDVRLRTTRRVLESATDRTVSGLAFEPDGKHFYAATNKDREFAALVRVGVKTGAEEWIVEERWDILGCTLSTNGRLLAYVVNENGRQRLRLLNTRARKQIALKLPRGHFGELEFTPDGRKLVFFFDDSSHPRDVYSLDLKTRKLAQLTRSLVGGLRLGDFATARLVHVPSFDGAKIPTWLLIPRGAKRDGTHPAIVWPHGGPEAQEADTFSARFQYFADAGYIVIAPNFRGSTGYGRSYQRAIYQQWDGACFRDVLASHDWLLASGWVDKRRVAVAGGSFGGYMALLCATRAPERWAAAVDVFGPANLLSFVQSAPPSWRPGLDRLVGNPERDRARLEEMSPITYLDSLRAPLLVVQGMHDPRIVKAESDQLVDRLRARGIPVEYIVFEDEGHGFSRVENQLKNYGSIVEFLDRHTGAGG